MDVSGLVAFESLLNELKRQGRRTIVVGAQRQPLSIMKKAGLLDQLEFVGTMEEAVERARTLR
jgi:anti-anti-sigma regulatory factor